MASEMEILCELVDERHKWKQRKSEILARLDQLKQAKIPKSQPCSVCKSETNVDSPFVIFLHPVTKQYLRFEFCCYECKNRYINDRGWFQK